ncbi:MAG: CCA tRNA nucleotidyltransferase [Methanocalculaceae archaeon]|nr:CCA tRNA nucleotidyltransferase [Methanocalculaceae archaeon]
MIRDPIEQEVLDRVLPTDTERATAQKIGEKLIAAVYEVAGVPAMMAGSVARGTWVRDDKDIDIFMLFLPELSREEMQEKGLAAAYAVVEKFSGIAEEKYAEHPYLSAVIEGFDIDLVPCYQVASAGEMKCAVDRTPFHTRYLLPKIGPLRDDILLLKQFTKGGGVYGSDHMIGGFSGYLCELLILAYGGFSAFMQAASVFQYSEVIDIEGHYPNKKAARKKFTEPLIVIDPTDKDRNVAAALTQTRFAEFVELARDYCTAPNRLYFITDSSIQMEKTDFAAVLKARETAMLAIRFKTPPYVADTVVPQLRKSMQSIKTMLVAEDFQIHRAEAAMGTENSLILFELLVSRLPALAIHDGPPIWNHENADRFVDKYLLQQDFAGPWIDGDRYYTEVRRKYTTAESLLSDKAKILSGALGKHVRGVMEDFGYEILSGTDVWSAEFSFFLSAFFARSSHAIRKLREIRQERTEL